MGARCGCTHTSRRSDCDQRLVFDTTLGVLSDPAVHLRSSDPQLMANSDREYISDGMTESIINNLSQLTNLKVIARSSVFRYKGKDLDVQAIGRELNVRSLVIGRVKQDGDELRIAVELMDVQGNRSIWGDTY